VKTPSSLETASTVVSLASQCDAEYVLSVMGKRRRAAGCGCHPAAGQRIGTAQSVALISGAPACVVHAPVYNALDDGVALFTGGEKPLLIVASRRYNRRVNVIVMSACFCSYCLTDVVASSLRMLPEVFLAKRA